MQEAPLTGLFEHVPTTWLTQWDRRILPFLLHQTEKLFLWVGVIYYSYACTEPTLLLFSVKSIILHGESNWIPDLISCSQWISIPMPTAEDLLSLPKHSRMERLLPWQTLTYSQLLYEKCYWWHFLYRKSDSRVNPQRIWRFSPLKGDGWNGRRKEEGLFFSLLRFKRA